MLGWFRTTTTNYERAGWNKGLLRRPEVLDTVGIAVSTLYDWVASGRFPRPVRLGPKARRLAKRRRSNVDRGTPDRRRDQDRRGRTRRLDWPKHKRRAFRVGRHPILAPGEECLGRRAIPDATNPTGCGQTPGRVRVQGHTPMTNPDSSTATDYSTIYAKPRNVPRFHEVLGIEKDGRPKGQGRIIEVRKLDGGYLIIRDGQPPTMIRNAVLDDPDTDQWPDTLAAITLYETGPNRTDRSSQPTAKRKTDTRARPHRMARRRRPRRRPRRMARKMDTRRRHPPMATNRAGGVSASRQSSRPWQVGANPRNAGPAERIRRKTVNHRSRSRRVVATPHPSTTRTCQNPIHCGRSAPRRLARRNRESPTGRPAGTAYRCGC